MKAGTCATAEELRARDGRLAAGLPRFTILVLVGELGAGKTTFMQGLAAGWNVAREEKPASHAPIGGLPSRPPTPPACAPSRPSGSGSRRRRRRDQGYGVIRFRRIA